MESHVVLSVIPNSDGTYGIQALAYGDECACLAFAKTNPLVTDDHREFIVVADAEKFTGFRDSPKRLSSLN